MEAEKRNDLTNDAKLTNEGTDQQNQETINPVNQENTEPETEPKPAAPTFKELWEGCSFEGKDLFHLGKDNVLTVQDGLEKNDHKITQITVEDFDNSVTLLQERFKEAQKQVQDLTEQWANEPEKLKLSHQLGRLGNYLHHVEALGDFRPLWESVSKMEQELKAQLADFYKVKLAIVEKAEALKDNKEAHRDEWDALIEEWKNSPNIEKEKSDQLWSRIDTARNAYYELQRQLIQDRNKEEMQNLDWKMELCDKAEALSVSEQWRETTEAFKQLFERWKEIGHVPSQEKNNELWERFNGARSAFYERKSAHYETIRKEQEENYEQKLKLVAETESLKDSTDWKKTGDRMEELMEEWKKIGRVPREKNDEIWEQFLAAREVFYANRREHYEEFIDELDVNLKKKMELVERANALKNSSDWKETTLEMNRLMDEWKKIGRVPREKGDEVWNHFLSARKHFFKRKDQNRDERRNQFFQRMDYRINQTRRFLNQLKDKDFETTEKLKDFRESLLQTTGNSDKDKELRQHLKDLIARLEVEQSPRIEKIADVEKQLKELLDKKEESLKRNKDFLKKDKEDASQQKESPEAEDKQASSAEANPQPEAKSEESDSDTSEEPQA